MEPMYYIGLNAAACGFWRKTLPEPWNCIIRSPTAAAVGLCVAKSSPPWTETFFSLPFAKKPTH